MSHSHRSAVRNRLGSRDRAPGPGCPEGATKLSTLSAETVPPLQIPHSGISHGLLSKEYSRIYFPHGGQAVPSSFGRAPEYVNVPTTRRHDPNYLGPRHSPLGHSPKLPHFLEHFPKHATQARKDLLRLATANEPTLQGN